MPDAPPPPAETRPTKVWTAERNAMLAERWHSKMPIKHLFAALSALPGPPISSLMAVQSQASGALKLGRRVEGESVLHGRPPPRPAARVVINDAPSVAARQLADDTAAMLAPIPITWDELVAWATQHANPLLDLKHGELLGAVNAERGGLPPFVLVDGKAAQRLAPLPEARIG